jgi:serine/threonine-protein kinase
MAADGELRAGAFVTPTLRLVRPLGAGGMGSVWIADHLALRTQVVVKFMAVELARNADALARFSREAAAASQVKSPHVVHVSDHGVTENGTPFIAMELLDGNDLRHRLDERGTLSPAETASIVAQVARALMAAHQRGIVHRDIKPENIFLTDAGGGELFVKVLDFGIAKSSAVEATSLATGTGAMIGTPYYMSPEQILGKKTLDFRADLWSLGVVVFEALTGQRPFTGETIGAVSVAICGAVAPRPSEMNQSLSPAIDEWFARACAPEPAKRFQSARDLADALAAAAAGAPAISSSSLSDGTAVTGRIAPTIGEPDRSAGHRSAAGAMLTTSGASASAKDSLPTIEAPASRRLALFLGGAVGAGVLAGLVAFALSRSGSGPNVAEPPRAASEHAAPEKAHKAKHVDSESTADDPPPSPAASTSAVASASATTSPRAAGATPTRAPAAAVPTVSSAPSPAPAPRPTKQKASDVVLE